IAWPTASETVTRGVSIKASASYDAAASKPAKGQWQWKYTVKITNESADTLQLVSRHWVIVEQSGQVFEVGPKASGVLGQQPILRPGESFTYSSAFIEWLEAELWEDVVDMFEATEATLGMETESLMRLRDQPTMPQQESQQGKGQHGRNGTEVVDLMEGVRAIVQGGMGEVEMDALNGEPEDRGRSLEDGLPDTPTNDLEVMQAGLMRMLGMLFVECSQLLPSHNVFQPVPPQELAEDEVENAKLCPEEENRRKAQVEAAVYRDWEEWVLMQLDQPVVRKRMDVCPEATHKRLCRAWRAEYLLDGEITQLVGEETFHLPGPATCRCREGGWWNGVRNACFVEGRL
ncbi:apaG, partial [Symbiodinium microadriaticum]